MHSRALVSLASVNLLTNVSGVSGIYQGDHETASRLDACATRTLYLDGSIKESDQHTTCFEGLMEAHMEALEKHRIALLNLLSTECAAYELMLKEDLAQRTYTLMLSTN